MVLHVDIKVPHDKRKEEVKRNEENIINNQDCGISNASYGSSSGIPVREMRGGREILIRPQLAVDAMVEDEGVGHGGERQLVGAVLLEERP